MESPVPKSALIFMVIRISSELQAIERIVLLVELAFQDLVARPMYIDHSIRVTD